VKVSFEEPEYTAQADGVGTLRLLEAIRTVGLEKTTRFYQASTSELYGMVQEVPQKDAGTKRGKKTEVLGEVVVFPLKSY